MIESVNMIGSGRVGSAVAARLGERGLELGVDDPDLVLLCVPDRVIADVAATLPLGPWVAHVSGATPLAALAPHLKRFGVHPLQTFTLRRGPEQLDGAWAAVTAESDEARTVGLWLAETLGLRPSRWRMRTVRRTTPEQPSRRTISSRSATQPEPCSSRPARLPRLSTPS